MENVIYWYSGTGNSLSFARRLADQLEGETVLYPIVNILHGDTEYPRPEKVCGFVFPLYGAEAPWPVLAAIEQMDIPEDAYIFAVGTCNERGGVSIDDFNNFLKRCSRHLSYGRKVSMPGNCLPSNQQENDERLFYENSEVQRTAENINKRMTGSYHGGNPNMNTVDDRRNMFGKTGFGQWSVSDSCIRCGLCAEICPMNNITLEDSGPVFGNNCGYCFGCYHWCPQKAVYLATFRAFGKEGRDQYHHPDISSNDIAAQKKTVVK